MDSKEIRARFISFFEERGHKVVPSSSLVSDDPTVLLTTAGMQQFKPYFIGKADPIKDFGSKNVVSIQKCFRTSDIDEVGDKSHLTFFEMLGNFSFGGYGKKEAIKYAHEFITKIMELNISYVTVFEGLEVTELVKKDKESIKIWKSLGITDIREGGMKDNFWGPTGFEGPCGPTTEIYVKNKNGKNIEVWNIVFNEFYCKGSYDQILNAPTTVVFTDLEDMGVSKGIDTGMGLERLAMVVQKKSTIFDTDLFEPIFKILLREMNVKTKRIFTDHLRGIAFLIADGVRPSNKETGYVLRRLIRRLIAYYTDIDFEALYHGIAREYQTFYPDTNPNMVISVFEEEENKFLKTLTNGMKKLDKFESIDAKIAFKLYESFGLPYETIKEVASEKAKKLTREDFDKEFMRHQEISRAGQEKKFGGHGLSASLREALQAGLVLDTGELKARSREELQKVTRLHTATHLLQKALREILGNEVEQRGSDITPERTRFDFSYQRKLTPEEIKKVEDLVNQKIKEDMPVNFKEMPIEEAKKNGALYFFREKYPETVKVYFIGDNLENAWSKEFCGGPHVKNTAEIGTFKILKEESVAAGIRRIRATVE